MGKVGASESTLLNMLKISPFTYGLQIGYPTIASVPHSIVNGFKNLLAVAAETEITFPEAEQMKAYLADPTAFAVAAPAEAEEAPAAQEEEKKEESEEEESDDDMGFGLFD